MWCFHSYKILRYHHYYEHYCGVPIEGRPTVPVTKITRHCTKCHKISYRVKLGFRTYESVYLPDRQF